MRSWLSAFLLATSIAGCASGGRPADAARTDAGGEEECGPLAWCGGGCVDLDVDPEHCGGCDRTCVVPHATAACSRGACVVDDCAPGYSDCDGSSDTGCEDANDCSQGGACSTSCGSSGALECADVCAPACVAPAEACNAIDDDCDGACETGLAGCRRGVHRSGGPAGHFYTLDAGEAACCGFHVESLNFYYIYAEGHDGLQPLFRCIAGDGHHYYTTDTAADGLGGIESQMGFIGRTQLCGSVPLHRLRHANGDHFYTVSDGERDSAVSLGYEYVGVTGYVWREP